MSLKLLRVWMNAAHRQAWRRSISTPALAASAKTSSFSTRTRTLRMR